MSMDRRIARAAAAIMRIDAPTAEERIRAIDVEIRVHDDALELARTRIAGIARQIRELREAPDGQKAAAALLQGGDVAETIEPEEKLVAERDALEAGRRELITAREALVRERDDARIAIREAVGTAAEPIADALSAEVQRLGDQLIEAYANVAAAAELTGNGKATTLRFELGRVVAALKLARVTSAASATPTIDLQAIARSPAVRLTGRGLPSVVPFPLL